MGIEWRSVNAFMFNKGKVVKNIIKMSSDLSGILELKEYLNRNKNNYFKSAIEIRIKCNDRTSLDARQFEILNEYIGKM